MTTRDTTTANHVESALLAHALPADIRVQMKTAYVLRRVPPKCFSTLLAVPEAPQAGDVVLARVETIGRNTALELTGGRRSSLHPGDYIAGVFGHRYATRQFEGYARTVGDACDLLSMGGLCGQVVSKHANAADPTKLRVVGALGDSTGRPLQLRDFALDAGPAGPRPQVIAVCGSSMDSGKTYTVMSLVLGLRQAGIPVAGIKLTGSATGRDTWATADAGACAALDFIDGGLPSTYLCSLEELLNLHDLLLAHAGQRGAQWVVVEIADGLLESETSALLQSPAFRETVSGWVFATGDPLGAVGGVSLLRGWGVEPLAVSGVVSMSPLGIREVEAGTNLPCLTAGQIQSGHLTAQILGEMSR